MDSDIAPIEDSALPLDSESAHDDDLGAILLNVEPALNDNLGINTDAPAYKLIAPSRNEESMRCVNCGIDIMHRRKRSLEPVEILSVIRQWTAPQVVTAQSLVCHSCWMLAFNNSVVQESEQSTRSGHQRQLCVNCGCSILHSRNHVLHTNSERETHIRNVISEWISPRQVHGSNRICHPCRQPADRASVSALISANVPVSTETITLQDYTRALDTQAHCFCPDCDSPQRLSIPTRLRVKLFIDFNFYVPKNSRICGFHLRDNNWAEVLSNISHPNQLIYDSE